MPEQKKQIRYSYAIRASEAINIPFPVIANLTWDGYWRYLYEKANLVIQRQANELLLRGHIKHEEVRQLVEVQRNGLVLEMRKPLSPFGRLYSETLKPAKDLPTLEKLLQRKGSLEAVLLSVGKTRAVTNRIAFISRVTGAAGIVLEIVAVAVVIEKAPPQDRVQVATEEITGAIGGLAGGTAGMWAGAAAGGAWAGTWASPTLMIPVVGAISEGGAILLGGLIGGLFMGWVGHDVSKTAATETWHLASVKWN
jgi:hypothetical protein